MAVIDMCDLEDKYRGIVPKYKRSHWLVMFVCLCVCSKWQKL